MSKRALSLLNQALSPELVSERETRDGRLVQYLEGWAAISQANRIFGFDGWSAELVGDVAYHPMRLIDAASGEQLAVAMYTATVRVSVKGCLPRTDAGCAFAYLDTPESHETAYKGAVTDALKRTLRQYGDQFANRLYERREQSADEVDERPKSTAAHPAPAEMRKRVVQLSARLGQDEAKARAWVEQRYEAALDELGPEQLADAVRYLADRLNRLNGAKPARPDGKATAA